MTLTVEADPDPLKGPDVEVKVIRAGIVFEDRPVLRSLVAEYAHGQPVCREADGAGWVCTRPKGHPAHWKHVASGGTSILSVWGGGPAPTATLVDPEDGTPPDPADLKVETVEVGKVYRLRDRQNKLQVIGGTADSIPRVDGLIEVLDLTKREFRAIPQAELVPTDYVLTIEDLTFVVQYTAKVRRAVYDEGVKHYHAGRWCEAGLQDALRDQGLPRYVPQQAGLITIRIPYQAPTDVSTRTVKAEFVKAANLEALKGLVLGDNEHDLVIRPSDLEVKIQDVTRK
jgi:hypothetical protein